MDIYKEVFLQHKSDLATIAIIAACFPLVVRHSLEYWLVKVREQISSKVFP